MNKETILAIAEVESHPIKHPIGYTVHYDGYKITTDKQNILVLIENDQQCCESWGYICTNDNMEEFIGANLLSINLTDIALNNANLPAEDWCDEREIQFVNLHTDKGLLQLAVYNAHNGYYGHSIYVQSIQLNHESCL